MNMASFAEKIRSINIPKTSKPDDYSTPDQIAQAVNGSLNWLATQSRPDLSTQVSFSQQAFPVPTVADALAANNAIRRAKHHRDQEVIFRSIPSESLATLCHSDAAFGNAKANATQACFLVGFTRKDIDKGELCDWSLVFWKSARLPRVVSSTLSAEAQSMAVAHVRMDLFNGL